MSDATWKRPITSSGHAITRYRERWCPEGTSFAEAKRRLWALLDLDTAVFVEEDGANAIWRIGEPDRNPMLIVVDAEGHLQTVLPRGATKTVRRPAK